MGVFEVGDRVSIRGEGKPNIPGTVIGLDDRWRSVLVEFDAGTSYAPGCWVGVNECYRLVDGGEYQGNYTQRRLTDEQVREARRLRDAGMKFGEIGRLYGVSESCIEALYKGRSYRDVA